MKKFADYNDYETAQHARGVAFAKHHWVDQLQPNDADLDSAAFVRGYFSKKYDLDYGPRGDGLEEYNSMVLCMLGIFDDEERHEYWWQLEQLDSKLRHALIEMAERKCIEEEEEKPAEVVDAGRKPKTLRPPRVNQNEVLKF